MSNERSPHNTLRKIHRHIDKVKLILLKKDKIFYSRYCHLFEQLKQSRQRFIDTINLDVENGDIKPIKLFLVQHNLAFGPGQGVLKFIKQAYLHKRVRRTSLQKAKDIVEKLILDEVEAFATGMSLYHVLHNMKLGGACCAVALLELKVVRDQIKTVPIHLTSNETARLSREIGHRLVKYHIMGLDSFWPEPDNITTSEQILNLVEDEALKTLLIRHLLTPKDKELLETLRKVHGQAGEESKPQEGTDDAKEIRETPYHDRALIWLKEWRATRRGEAAIEELLSRTSKVGKQYRRQILRISLKYWVLPSVAKMILAVQRLLTVMYLPFKDYKPNGQIVILDTGIAPAIVQGHLLNLKELEGEDVVVISVLAKRLGGSSPKRIEQLCRIYAEAAYNLGAKIVLLCNTMDANALATLVKEFPIPIIGPIIPAVKAALKYWKAHNIITRNIGVIATKATIESSAYVNEIQNCEPEAKVFNVIAPLLATMVDIDGSGKMESQVMSQRNLSILEANLRPLTKKNIDILILGCTHYGVFEQAIHEIWKRCTGKEIFLVNSSRELPNYILTYLRQNRILSLRCDQKGTISHMASAEDATRFKQGIMKITGHAAEVIPMDIGEVVGRLSDEDRLFQETVFRESREDINLRGIIINSNLSAEIKVAIADKMYGTGNMKNKQMNGEILKIELKDEHIRELVRLAIGNKNILKILSNLIGSDLQVIKVQKKNGEARIFVRSNTQNYFIIGENNCFVHILLPLDKNFKAGLRFFKTLDKYIHVKKIDLSFLGETVTTYHKQGELEKFNEALKKINKIKQKMERNKEFPNHSRTCTKEVKQYLERIGFRNVLIETKKVHEVEHSYIIIVLLDTEVIIDISASQFERVEEKPGVFYMRDVGIVVIPRKEVANVQQTNPKLLFFYDGKYNC